ncbi:hypothetical protein [Thermogutta sp.]|uniref:hypothetical protein n=1 Tax=Thermogutta sp. TaxID=1962930 RepID=UPI003C7C187F
MASDKRALLSIPARALFQFAVPCRHCATLWDRDGANLDESYRLPNLAAMEGTTPPLEVRAGWNEAGLVLRFHIFDLQIGPRARRMVHAAQWIHVWIATRAVHDVHRATRYCHRFVLLANGASDQAIEAKLAWVGIPRAKEAPNPPPPGSLNFLVREYTDGYCVDMLFSKDALTGYDPHEYPRLGFNYAVCDLARDREFVFTAGRPLPYDEDPSLWATLELVS